MARRSYGTGSIRVRDGTWHGQWRVGDRQVSRRLDPVRHPGTRRGLTKKHAEARLRALIRDVKPAAPASDLTVAEAGQRFLRHVDHVMQRSRPPWTTARSCAAT
jgi:hypothetical protein